MNYIERKYGITKSEFERLNPQTDWEEHGQKMERKYGKMSEDDYPPEDYGTTAYAKKACKRLREWVYDADAEIHAQMMEDVETACDKAEAWDKLLTAHSEYEGTEDDTGEDHFIREQMDKATMTYNPMTGKYE